MASIFELTIKPALPALVLFNSNLILLSATTKLIAAPTFAKPCFSVIINGGAIRMEDELNKNQSTITPFSMHLSIIALF